MLVNIAAHVGQRKGTRAPRPLIIKVFESACPLRNEASAQPHGEATRELTEDTARGTAPVIRPFIVLACSMCSTAVDRRHCVFDSAEILGCLCCWNTHICADSEASEESRMFTRSRWSAKPSDLAPENNENTKQFKQQKISRLSKRSELSHRFFARQ